MDKLQLMNLSSAASYVCLGILILGFGIAIFAFFRFKIPVTFAMMTGRYREKTVRKMQASENLMEAAGDVSESGEPSENMKNYYNRSEDDASTAPLKGDPAQQLKAPPAAPAAQAAPAPASAEAETSVLRDPNDSVLAASPNAPSADGVPVSEAGATGVLRRAPTGPAVAMTYVRHELVIHTEEVIS